MHADEIMYASFYLLFVAYANEFFWFRYSDVNLKLRREEYTDISAILATVSKPNFGNDYSTSRGSLHAYFQRSSSPPLSEKIQAPHEPFVPVIPRSRRINPVDKPEDRKLKLLENVSRKLLPAVEMAEVEDPVDVQNMLIVDCDGWRKSILLPLSRLQLMGDSC